MPGQAYRYWKNSSHEYLFISNNDVLVPDGVMTSLMHAMRDGGAPADGAAALRLNAV